MKKASDIIRQELINNGGSVQISSLKGNPIFIELSRDRNHFNSPQLRPRRNESLAIFDCVTDLLDRNGGTARKGNGRNHKLGEKGCETDTVVGYIGSVYDGHKIGESVLDPVFAIAAIMDWAGIVHNKRGYIQYTSAYLTLRTK